MRLALAWADGLAPETVGITTMSEAEILHGIARLLEGRRREGLQRSWDALLQALFSERVLAFDREAAHWWYAQLLRQRERLGRPMTTTDAVIAAITLARGAGLATRNVADFEGIGIDLIQLRAERRSERLSPPPPAPAPVRG